MVTIYVTDLDEAPVIMRGGLAISGKSSVSYAENGTAAVATYAASGPEAASATWSLEDVDAGDFRISRSGVLTFRSAPDFENPTDMGRVTVEADDGTRMDAVTATQRRRADG